MNIKDFLIDNYIYIIIIIGLTIVTIIGFLADKKKPANKIVSNNNPAPVPPAPMNNQGNVAPMTYQPPQDNVMVNNNMAMPGQVQTPMPEPVMNNNVTPLPNLMNQGSVPIPEAVLNNSIKTEPMMMNGNMVMPGPTMPAPEPVPNMMNQLFEKNGLQKDDIDYYVFHQANKFMLNTIRKVCALPKDKFYIDLANVGNTVSSTILIGLKECLNNNII